MHRIEPYFPLSHGVSRVGDRRIIKGAAFMLDALPRAKALLGDRG